MSSVKIFWDPSGLTIDKVGPKKYSRITDGDTPFVTVSVRMLSIDAPEVHYRGKPSKHDASLKQLAEWIEKGHAPVDKDLGNYLLPKLKTGTAGTQHEQQGEQSTIEFEKLLKDRLTKPNGKQRSLYLHAANEHFDSFGRLLAYLAPNYSESERRDMPRKERATFNLLLVESGWAAPFPIYPSLPRYSDLVLLQTAAKEAFTNKRGIWSNPNTLTGYEFRMCVRLHATTKKLVEGKKLSMREKYSWIERYCIDMTTLEIFFPQSYHKVAAYNRIFVWPRHVTDAVAKLNLIPAK